MMVWTHLVFSLLFYSIILKLFHLSFSFFVALILCLGTVLPDIDTPSSFIGKKFFVLGAHRGFWHSLFGLIFFGLLAIGFTSLFKVSKIYGPIIMAGYALHLAADSLNPTGVKWFWKSGHVRGFIKTGSTGEVIFFTLLIFCLLLIFT